MDNPITYTAFEGHQLFCQGTLSEVVTKIKKQLGKAEHGSILIFSDATGKVIDFNFQGTQKDVMKRLDVFVADQGSSMTTGPGRPKLGVMSREISLLPQHWEWLATQPGGASFTLRKLVDEARRKMSGHISIKATQEKVHRFMTSIGGDLEGFEDALRALYRKDQDQFMAQMKNWPMDLRKHIIELAKPVFNGV